MKPKAPYKCEKSSFWKIYSKVKKFYIYRTPSVSHFLRLFDKVIIRNNTIRFSINQPFWDSFSPQCTLQSLHFFSGSPLTGLRFCYCLKVTFFSEIFEYIQSTRQIMSWLERVIFVSFYLYENERCKRGSPFKTDETMSRKTDKKWI